MVSVEIPPRGSRLDGVQMLVAFDVDCGELVSGHHFVARGLSPSAIPHPDDLTGWDEANPLPDALRGGGYFISFRVPPDGFDDDDISTEASMWRRGQRRMDAIKQARQVPGFELHYELVPGISATEVDVSGTMLPFLVEVVYAADRDLPWDVNDGGTIAPAEGGPTTHGSRGAWPIPDGARVLTFTIAGVDPDTGFPREEADGVLTIDLQTGSATWKRAT